MTAPEQLRALAEWCERHEITDILSATLHGKSLRVLLLPEDFERIAQVYSFDAPRQSAGGVLSSIGHATVDGVSVTCVHYTDDDNAPVPA